MIVIIINVYLKQKCVERQPVESFLMKNYLFDPNADKKFLCITITLTNSIVRDSSVWYDSNAIIDFIDIFPTTLHMAHMASEGVPEICWSSMSEQMYQTPVDMVMVTPRGPVRMV